MPELLTLAQASARLGIGSLELRRMIRTEQCPVVHIGRRQRIPADWVEEEAASWSAQQAAKITG